MNVMWAVRIFVLAILLLAAPAMAQDPGKILSSLTGKTEPAAQEQNLPTPEQTKALITLLEDEKARQQLIDQLKLLQQAAPKPETTEAIVYEGIFAPFIEGISTSLRGFSSQLSALFDIFTNLPKIVPWAERKFADGAALARLGQSLGVMILVAGFGMFGVWLMRRIIQPINRRLNDSKPRHWSGRMGRLLGRWILDAVLAGAFAGAAFAVLSVLAISRQAESLSISLIITVMAVRLMQATVRLVLAPHKAQWRLNRLGDETALYLDIWSRRLIYTASYGYFICVLARQIGLPASAFDAIIKLLGLVVASMVIMLVLQNRSAIDQWLRQPSQKAETDPSTSTPSKPVRRPLAVRGWFVGLWHILVIAYVAALYLTWALEIKGGFSYLTQATLKTIVILVVARAVFAGVRHAIRRSFRVDPEAAAAFPALEKRANRYVPVLVSLAGGLVWCVAAIAIMAVWGLDSLSWVKHDEARRALASLLRLAALLVGTVVLWELIGGMIERWMKRLEEAHGTGTQRTARLRTLLPLVRTVSTVVLAVIVGLIVLSELGVNIAPLLAGAGIIGVAIGFGSQKLVQDVMTGLFMLIEDSLAVGEVIDLGSHAGVIEAISLRTLRLRDVYGTVHVVPYSEISTIKNLTREFAFAVMDIGVSYREDIDHVIRVIEDTATELVADPKYAPDILEPIEVFGVDQFADSAMIIKARLKTRAMGQWAVRRAFNRLLKINFDRAGIEMPYPHRTIYFGQARDGTAPAAHIEIVAQPQRNS